MKTTAVYCFCMSLALNCLPVLRATELDDLLEDKGTSKGLEESAIFQKNWDQLLDELAQRKYEEAGKTLSNLERERSYVLPQHRDFVRLSSRVVHYNDTLESDKEEFRDRYKKSAEAVQNTEAAIKRLKLDAQAVARNSQHHVSPLARENMEKKYVELKKIRDGQIKAHAKMKAAAADFENSRFAELETEVSKWIGATDTEEGVVTGLLLATAFLDRVGDSAGIRQKSQGLNGKQQELEKASKIVAAVSSEIDPLIAEGRGEDADAELDAMIAKINTSDQSDFLKKVVVSKLEAIRIKVDSASRNEGRRMIASAEETAAIDGRLRELETKLESAQELFGEVIRSTEGFADFTGTFTSETEKEKAKATLKEQMSSKTVSRARMDNMTKARSEHAGIIKELDFLGRNAESLSLVQKAKMEGLRTTAQTALDLLGP